MKAESPRIKIFTEAFASVLDHPAPALALPSFTGSSAAFAATALACHTPVKGVPFVLVVTPGLPEADRMLDDLTILANECTLRVLEFPPALEDDPSATSARLKAAAVLSAYRIRPYPLVLVASLPALLTGVPQAAALAANTLYLSLDKSLPSHTFAVIQERLTSCGYARVYEVEAPGSYSIRGGVLDVWVPGDEKPVRAEFFGDDLESLRRFNPATQVSIAPIPSLEILPITLPDQDNQTQTLIDVLPEGCTVMWLEHNAYPHNLKAIGQASRTFYTGDPAPAGVPTISFNSSPLPGFSELGAEAIRNPELLDSTRARLEAYLTAARQKGILVVDDAKMTSGFEVPGLIVVATSDRVFAHHHRTSAGHGRGAVTGERLVEALDLEPGELVVHLDHGIGRFVGSTEIEVGGKRSEVFTVEYADGAKLHVPVTHAHLLSRYVGVKGGKVNLHRLDGRRWLREKADAQQAIRDLAAALLETQARRAVVPGFACNLGLPGLAAFEASFPYEPTPDQAAAIEAVKKDLASRKPMDRLICGDAGYGKTEVAMRAAFIMAMNGRQVVLLAPTTVLAEQHYETFLARFNGTPIRIEAMSRFQSVGTRMGTRARLLSGGTDIVIGTHALLSEKIHFHDLGLIIIDEEQRFGVKHKEWLKSLRATADVLTMSATPIPRTLYLSMTGARDLSVLKTPPRERVAVETQVMRDNDATVRAAITRELARGGQVYYLYNRVLTIEKARTRLHALVPKARIDVAHGQMDADILATKMRRFARGEIDVLLCTTIVESGLDIPRANTILVDRADRFGLAELYQLRGRVGRSARQGYAFFFLPEEGLIDAEARERLTALKKHAGLGAGFQIALRDLEIRGAGNLLGSEQSGHIAAVGFSLYCQLLQRTISHLKGEEIPDVIDVSLNLDFLNFSPGAVDAEEGACLPYDYVEGDAQRMAFHRRLAETVTLPAVRKLRAELADRYGKLPRAALRLIKLAEFRILCAQAHINRLDVKDARATFHSSETHEIAFIGHIEGNTADGKMKSLFKMLNAWSQKQAAHVTEDNAKDVN